MIAKALPNGYEKYSSEADLKKKLSKIDEELISLKPRHSKIMKKSNRYAQRILTLGLCGLLT